MTAHFALSPEQIEEFDRRGVLRLEGLLSAERVRHARDYVQSRLARVGLWRDSAWRLDEHPKPQWPASGVNASKTIGNKHPSIEALIEESALLAAVSTLLDGRAFDRELFKRPQVLFMLPNAGAWTMPTGWHVDGPRLKSGKRPGVQLFVCLDTVEPCGGGTLVVAGSHRLFNDGRHLSLKELKRLLMREDFFRALYSPSDSARDRARPLNRVGAIGDVRLELVECTGAPGDAYLIDLRALHAVAPNASARPRMMATHRFWCADVMQELSEAYGWD